MTADLDTIIADVEAILRLRCAVRNARETLVRTRTELSSAENNLAAREAGLAKSIGVKPTSSWHRATLPGETPDA